LGIVRQSPALVRGGLSDQPSAILLSALSDEPPRMGAGIPCLTSKVSGAQLGRCLMTGEVSRQRSGLGLSSYRLDCDRVPW